MQNVLSTSPKSARYFSSDIVHLVLKRSIVSTTLCIVFPKRVIAHGDGQTKTTRTPTSLTYIWFKIQRLMKSTSQVYLQYVIDDKLLIDL